MRRSSKTTSSAQYVPLEPPPPHPTNPSNLRLLQFKTNVVGVINATNIFLPLVRAGSAKKIIAISSPAGEPSFVAATGIYQNVQYGISKAAMNLAVADFAAALKPEGDFTVLALCPGVVQTWSDKKRQYPRLVVEPLWIRC